MQQAKALCQRPEGGLWLATRMPSAKNVSRQGTGPTNARASAFICLGCQLPAALVDRWHHRLMSPRRLRRFLRACDPQRPQLRRRLRLQSRIPVRTAALQAAQPLEARVHESLVAVIATAAGDLAPAPARHLLQAHPAPALVLVLALARDLALARGGIAVATAVVATIAVRRRLHLNLRTRHHRALLEVLHHLLPAALAAAAAVAVRAAPAVAAAAADRLVARPHRPLMAADLRVAAAGGAAAVGQEREAETEMHLQ